MSADGHFDPIEELLRRYHSEEVARAKRDIDTSFSVRSRVAARSRARVRGLSAAGLAAVTLLVVGALAASTLLRPPVPGPTPTPTASTSPSTSPSTPLQSPTPAPQTDRQRAQAIADRLIEQGAATGGRATAAGYVRVKLSVYGKLANPAGPTLLPTPQSGDDLLVVEVDGWFPAPRGFESPNPVATSGTATNITLAWDLRLERQIDVRFGFDPESSEVPGASPVLGHHMTSLTSFGTDLVPLAIVKSDGSPERRQAELLVEQLLATSKGQALAAGYMAMTYGELEASRLFCGGGGASPQSITRPCPTRAGASATATGSPNVDASDRVLVVELDGAFWGGPGYSRPKPGVTSPPRPADRYAGIGPLPLATSFDGLAVFYDMTTGTQIGQTVLVGKAPGMWFLEAAGEPTVLWDWTGWRPSPS
jgi:hypothetical protein